MNFRLFGGFGIGGFSSAADAAHKNSFGRLRGVGVGLHLAGRDVYIRSWLARAA